MAKLSIKGNGLTPFGYEFLVDGRKIEGMTSLELCFEVDDANRAKLGFLVDEMEIDAEALLTRFSLAPGTKLCPVCGKLMVRWLTNEVLLTYPAQYPWTWRCGCGHEEPGGVERGKSLNDLFREKWEAANRIKPA